MGIICVSIGVCVHLRERKRSIEEVFMFVCVISVKDVEEDMELPVQEGLKPLNRAKNRYNQVISCQSTH